MGAAASPTYGPVAAWRYIATASVHNTWLIALPMLLVLSHRNIVGAMVLMVVLGSFIQPGFWPAAVSWLRPAMVRAGGWASVLAVLAGFCAWAFLSVLWTPLKQEWVWALQMILLILFSAGLLWTAANLPRHIITLLSRFMLGAGLVAIITLGIEAVTGGGVRDLIPPEGRSDKDIVAAARGTSIALYLLPAVLYLGWRQFGETGRLPGWALGGIGVALTGCLAAGAIAFNVSANVLALGLIAVAAIVTLRKPSAGLWMVFSMWVAALVLAPFVAALLPPIEDITQLEGETSWVQRLGIWRFTADHIFSDPLTFLFGGGVNYSQALSDTRTMITLPGYPEDVSIMPTHPHNVFLQVWLEFGLVGAAIIIIAFWRALKTALSHPQIAGNRHVACVSACIGAAFIAFCLVDASLWTPWRLAAPVYGLYFLIAALRSDYGKPSS